MPLLFALEKGTKHYVVYEYDSEKGKWYIDFEKQEDKGGKNE